MKILPHPVLLHFPIAFYFLELLFLLRWAVKGDPAYERFAVIVFKIGYCFMLAALLTGLFDAGWLRDANPPTWRHFYAASAVFVFYTGRAFYLKVADRMTGSYMFFQIAGALAGNLILAAAAYFGGRLVYS